MKKIILTKDKPLVLPSKAKEHAKALFHSDADKIYVNEEDYFLLKFIDLLSNNDVVYVYNDKEYKDLYDIEDLFIFEVFEELYDLDVLKNLQNKEVQT